MNMQATLMLLIFGCLLVAPANCMSHVRKSCSDCDEHSDSTSDQVISDMQNEANSATLAISESNSTAADDDTMLLPAETAREVYERERISVTILNTLISYGYRPNQLSNEALIEEKIPRPLKKEVDDKQELLQAIAATAEDDQYAESEEEVADSAAETIVYLHTVLNRPNNFELDLSDVNVNVSVAAMLYIGVPSGAHRITVYEKSYGARTKVAVKRITSEPDSWSRISIKPKTLKKWKTSDNSSSIVLEIEYSMASVLSPVASKQPYIMVSLMPVAGSVRRFRRSVSHCNLVGQYVDMRQILHFTVFPAGLSLSYCTGSCSSIDRDQSPERELNRHIAGTGLIPHSKVCCVPKEYQPFSILVVLDSQAGEVANSHSVVASNSSSNARIIKIDIPRLSAKHCACV